jgi:hypothetical protein
MLKKKQLSFLYTRAVGSQTLPVPQNIALPTRTQSLSSTHKHGAAYTPHDEASLMCAHVRVYVHVLRARADTRKVRGIVDQCVSDCVKSFSSVAVSVAVCVPLSRARSLDRSLLKRHEQHLRG